MLLILDVTSKHVSQAKRKWFFSEKKETDQITEIILTCAPISELPSNINTMQKNNHVFLPLLKKEGSLI